MNKLYLILVLMLFNEQVNSQTCCSGGVPLSGNIGFTSTDEKSIQFDISYDYNLLRTLLVENRELDDNSRTRITQSVLFKSGYSISKNFGIDFLFTYVEQNRTISQFSNVVTDKTRGIGDAVLLGRYMFSIKKVMDLKSKKLILKNIFQKLKIIKLQSLNQHGKKEMKKILKKEIEKMP